jgi:hypothetical protein
MNESVRRVKKFSSSSVSGDPEKKSLTGFLDSGDRPRQRLGGSASVAGDMIAVGKEASLTGEVYVRADGKKVRRVKKSSLSSSSSSVGPDESFEIITRPDGTKVKRILRVKPVDTTSSATNGTSTTTYTPNEGQTNDDSSPTDNSNASKSGLSGFLSSSPTGKKKQFSGSHSVAGDQHLEGEIYLRADGKKVRRVRKVKASPSGSVTSETSTSSSLSGFLDSDTADKSRVKGGAATVAGDVGGGGNQSNTDTDRPEMEIYVRPDGTKVRRIRRTAVKPAENESPPAEEKKTLDGFLLKKEQSSPRRKIGGSASVAGDQIAVSKESSLTGEVYVRADGKKGECEMFSQRYRIVPSVLSDIFVLILTFFFVKQSAELGRRLRQLLPMHLLQVLVIK